MRRNITERLHNLVDDLITNRDSYQAVIEKEMGQTNPNVTVIGTNAILVSVIDDIIVDLDNEIDLVESDVEELRDKLEDLQQYADEHPDRTV